MIFNINSTRGHTGSLLVSTITKSYMGYIYMLLYVCVSVCHPYCV